MMRVLDSHPGVFTVIYMGNVYLVGQLEATLAAARSLLTAYGRIWTSGCRSTPLGAGCAPLPGHDWEQCQVPLALPSNPVTTAATQAGTGRDQGSQSNQAAGAVQHVKDGLLHFQLICFCIQAKFTYLTCCIAPAVTLAAALKLNHASVAAIGDSAKWPPRLST
eukprot:2082837-Rhodomonas_salina.2